MKPTTAARYSAALMVAVTSLAWLAPVHAEKRALVVTLGEYLPSTGWAPISAAADYPLIRSALAMHGFDAGNVKQLSGPQATRDGILAAIRRELIEPSEPGDVVVFHFSGHGQQVSDDDGDEIDGYDEALVPYDAPRTAANGYSGEKHLRDDDLGAVLDELRAKLGPTGDVIVSLDSCYSGTATRGVETPYPYAVRGEGTPIGPPQRRDEAPGADTGGGFVERSANNAADRAPMVVFSAEMHNALAEETSDDAGGRVGALSWALSASLARAGKTTSYQDLFEAVTQRTAERAIPNNPQAEGDLDRAIFGGQAVDQEPFHRVTAINTSERRAELEGGELVGLLDGAEVEIHDAGARAPTPTTLIARGRVRLATPFASEVELTEIVRAGATTGRAFVTRRSFGSLKVSVYVDAAPQTPWADDVRTALAAAAESSPYIELLNARPATATGGAARTLLVRAVTTGPLAARGIMLETWDSGVPLLDRALAPTDPNLELTLVERIRMFARNAYLRGFHSHSPGLDVELDVIPCKLACSTSITCSGTDRCQCEADLDADFFVSEGNELRLTRGSGFRLRLRNVGTSPAYVSILDLMPNGMIGQAWPIQRTSVADTLLTEGRPFDIPDPGASGRPLAFLACPPYGTDVLKVIATTEPVDFGVLTGRTRGPEAPGPLDVLFEETLKGVRGMTPSFPPGSVSTTDVVVTIVPPGD